MITLSQAYLRLNAYRKFSFFLDYASENGIKRGLDDLCEWLQARARLAPATTADIGAMRASPQTAFPLLIGHALGGGFPVRSRNPVMDSVGKAFPRADFKAWSIAAPTCG